MSKSRLSWFDGSSVTVQTVTWGLRLALFNLGKTPWMGGKNIGDANQQSPPAHDTSRSPSAMIECRQPDAQFAVSAGPV